MPFLFLLIARALQEVSEPTKEEKAVAKYLRFNCPTKSTNMMGHRVDYFVGECPAAGRQASAKEQHPGGRHCVIPEVVTVKPSEKEKNESFPSPNQYRMLWCDNRMTYR